MITKFNIFENNFNNNFNKGDIVKCINSDVDAIIEGELYKIQFISNSTNVINLIEEPAFGFNKNRFKLATKDEIELYNMKKTTDKFNL